jgi:hypothetical protein
MTSHSAYRTVDIRYTAPIQRASMADANTTQAITDLEEPIAGEMNISTSGSAASTPGMPRAGQNLAVGSAGE